MRFELKTVCQNPEQHSQSAIPSPQFRIAIADWHSPWYIAISVIKERGAMQLTIDRFGRMVLPKSIRDGLGLSAGDRVQAEVSQGAITLRPVSRTDCTSREGRVLVFTGKAVGDIGGMLASVRETRLNRAGGTGEHA